MALLARELARAAIDFNRPPESFGRVFLWMGACTEFRAQRNNCAVEGTVPFLLTQKSGQSLDGGVCPVENEQRRSGALPNRIASPLRVRPSPPASPLSHLFAIVLFLGAGVLPALAVDQVTIRRGGKTTAVEGRVVVTARDGGLLLLGRDGLLWMVPPGQLVKHTHDDRPFEPLGRDELIERILPELPAGFKADQTAHYVIFYDTSPAYARWCGSLFERLYLAFRNFWTHKGFTLTQPEFPLVAVVFADRDSYLKFSQPELGAAGEAIIGYYSRISNRMTMYDLTGVESHGRGAGKTHTTAEINQVLAQPDALPTVATIVHEATHQIAFNCGLHARLSDCPLWFCEGIAMYCETPDLSSPKGWKGIGAINRPRVEQFSQYLASRPANSLETLIRDDKRFHDMEHVVDAYAEAWALTYYLMRQHSKEYVSYLAMLSKKKPLIDDTPDRRLDQFRKCFGDLDALDARFRRFMSHVR